MTGTEAAGVTPVASWTSADTRLAEVLGALTSVRSGIRLCGTRAAVVNLVILAAAEAGARRAVDSILHLGAHHPGRIVVLVPRDDLEPGRLEARVDLHQSVIAGRAIWWDVVHLDIPAGLAAHADSVVEPLLMHDLPVTLWLAGGSTWAEPCLLAVTDQLVVSGERAAQEAPERVQPDLEALADRRPLTDLAWLSLEPTRRALARLFDGDTQSALAGLHGVTLSGPPWSTRLLAGWLLDRLGLDPGRIRRHPDQRLSAELDLGREGTAVLDAGDVWPAGRDDGTGPSPAGAAVAQLGRRRIRVAHAGSGTPQLLGLALRRPGADPLYRAALAQAGKLAS